VVLVAQVVLVTVVVVVATVKMETVHQQVQVQQTQVKVVVQMVARHLVMVVQAMHNSSIGVHNGTLRRIR
jgi:hypothetical protein